MHFDGTAIRLKDAGFTNLFELDVTADAGPFIVGSGAAMLVSDGDGGLRSIVSRQSPPGLDLSDLDGSGPNDLWAVGAAGLALHYTGTSWQRVDTGTTNQLVAVISDAPNSAYAVGANDVVIHFDGTGWQPLAAPPAPSNGLAGVWKTAGSDLWVVADNKIARYNGTSWSSVTPPGGCCSSVFGFSNSRVHPRSPTRGLPCTARDLRWGTRIAANALRAKGEGRDRTDRP
ncbi:MAG: hypothetical protein LH616_08595 [Ilumatobacteraceae bacterium]|nr:hypothetical protein [Ilumatobacteraceae bacterium]